MHMKKTVSIFLVIFLISIMIAGGTFAWFTSVSDVSLRESKIGTVKVDVMQRGLDKVEIKNYGTSEVYIRARLMPQWSDHNLSISNVEIKVADDWIEKDGYYYYKHPVKENEMTKDLIKDIVYKDLTEEYEGAQLKLEISAEGVQSRNGAWKRVWNIKELPFEVRH